MPSAQSPVPMDISPAKPPMVSKSGRKLTVTRRVQAAIAAMVWEGLKRGEAAAKAGMTEHSLYVALRSPHVKQHYLAECDVLRTSGRARRIHRLEQMAEQDENKAAVVNAIRALELMDADQPANRGSQSQPGLTIVINTVAQSVVRQVDDERPLAISNG